MRKIGRPRQTPAREESTPVSTRFADSFIKIIDRHKPQRGEDRSEVIRQALLVADLYWSREQIETMPFDTLLNLSQPRIRADDDPAAVDTDHLRRVTMLATGTVASETDLPDFATTISLLGHGPLTDVHVVGPGQAAITAYTGMQRYCSGPEGAASDLMRRLALLPDLNPWKLPLARQVMNPANWSVETITRAQYETLSAEEVKGCIQCLSDEAVTPPTPIEIKLRALAEDLIAKGTMHSWGGGGPDGPTKGISDGGGLADQSGDFETEGFDAGSLAQFVYKQAFGISKFPRVTNSQYGLGTRVGVPHPGDLVFPVSQGQNFAVIYLGHGEALSAERSGQPIRIQPVFTWGPVEIFRVADTGGEHPRSGSAYSHSRPS